MLRRCALLLIGLAVALPAGAQTGWVTLTNSVALTNLDGSGDPINNAEACFEITNNAGQLIGVHIGSANGHAAGGSICTPVSSGMIGSIQLPDTNLTTPKNACIQLTITSDVATGGDGSTVFGGPGSGYSCLQPAYNNNWCTNGSCDLSKYLPTTTPGVVQVVGITGATGPPPNIGIGSVTTLAPGSSASASVTGSGGNYSLNLNLPAGTSGVGANPAGGAQQVQYAASTSAFGADSLFTYNPTTHTLAAPNFRGELDVNTYPGSDACAKINACLAAATAAPPGICNAMAITGYQACANPIVPQSHTTLFLADNVALDGGSNPIMVSPSGVGLIDFTVEGVRPLPIQNDGTVNGSALESAYTGGPIVDLGDPTGTALSQNVYLRNLGVKNTLTSSSAGTNIRFSYIENYGMENVSSNVHSGGTNTHVDLNGIGTGAGTSGNSYFLWINNQLSNGHVGILVHSGANAYSNDQNSFVGGSISLNGATADTTSTCVLQDGGDSNDFMNLDNENCATALDEYGSYNYISFFRTENVTNALTLETGAHNNTIDIANNGVPAPAINDNSGANMDNTVRPLQPTTAGTTGAVKWSMSATGGFYINNGTDHKLFDVSGFYGNATSATTASQVAATSTSANQNYFPCMFPANTSGSYGCYLPSGLAYNPSTGVYVIGKGYFGYGSPISGPQLQVDASLYVNGASYVPTNDVFGLCGFDCFSEDINSPASGQVQIRAGGAQVGMFSSSGLLSPAFTASGAAATAASGQVSYGGQTASNSNCGGSAVGATGCIIINVGGTTHYLPYW